MVLKNDVIGDKGVGQEKELLLTKGQLMRHKIVIHPLSCLSLASATLKMNGRQ